MPDRRGVSIVADGLRPEFKVREQVSGSCWIGSIIASRTDAWRCSTQCVEQGVGEVASILDPCLVNPFDPGGPLACVQRDLSVRP